MVGEEVVLQNFGYTHQHLGVDGGFLEYPINIRAVTGDLFSKPHYGLALSFQFFLDSFSDVHSQGQQMCWQVPGFSFFNN